jgi:alkanesulfonate monooxygenase SsuD/methylene tetrahydromethanopterin reductase-like flavin-dependent oxidoreductase (luciferase family)
MCCIAPTHDQAWAEAEVLAARLGMDLSDPATREVAASLIFIGGPDEVGEKLAEVLASGVDGWTIACPANGHIPERVELLGQTASKLLA